MIKRYKAIASVLGLVALFGLGWAEPVHANPSTFAISTSTSAATTSPAYLTAGLSTSTLPVYDAYTQTLNGGATFKADFAGLLIQLAASSTATVLSANVEYSNNGIDWYRNFAIDPNQPATTTAPVFKLGNPFSMSWTFASSTMGGTGLTNANSATSTAAVLIPTPFRYTRVWFGLSGGNGAIWAQLIPIKERP